MRNDLHVHYSASLYDHYSRHGVEGFDLLTTARVLNEVRQRAPGALLDVGTGTGVLAIALAKRLHRPVVATDIDPIAVRTAHNNARDNGVGNEVFAIEATGLDHRVIAANAPYDLIVANILAGPLIELAPAFAKALSPGGTIILGGLLDSQADAVIAAHEQRDLSLCDRGSGEWPILVLTS